MTIGNKLTPSRSDTISGDQTYAASVPPAEATRIRVVVSAAALGTMIEYFDLTVYAFLATIIAAVFFPRVEPTAALLYTLAVFGVAYVVRPLGGVLLGSLADRHGRKPALAVSVLGMAVASFFIGLVPSFASIGLAAPFLLFTLRCLQGLSSGGELGGAAAYVAEVAPDHNRGFLTSTTQIGTVSGTLLASLTVAILHMALTKAQILDWGWRIPFLISLPIGVAGFFIRLRLEESAQFAKIERLGEVERVPALAALISNPRGVFTVCGLSMVSFASYYLVFTYSGTYFARQGIMSPGAATWSTTISLILAGISIPFWGKLADHFGRRPLLIGVCLADLIFSYPAFLVMQYSPLAASLAQIGLGLIEAAYLGVILATYCELFPVRFRTSGFSLGYNIAAILAGGSAPYIATWLIARTGQSTSPSWMLVATAVISLIFAVTARETSKRPLPVD